jgi:hypothetical protein
MGREPRLLLEHHDPGARVAAPELPGDREADDAGANYDKVGRWGHVKGVKRET